MILSPHGAFYCACLNVINEVGAIITGLPSIEACISFMIVESAIFLTLSFYMDIQSSVVLQPTTDPSFQESVLESLDEDVLAEREQTLGADNGSAPLMIKRLRKVFPSKVAGRQSVTGRYCCESSPRRNLWSVRCKWSGKNYSFVHVNAPFSSN
jgi:hypothetical protein